VLENPTPDEEGIAGMVNLAIASYRAANEAWSAEVAPHAYDLEAKYTGWELERVRLTHNLRNELLRQSEWEKASAYLKAARDIQSGSAFAKTSLDDRLAQIEYLRQNPPGMVDNPEYRRWSAFRPGAMATMAEVGEDGAVGDGEWTTTLKELTADEAVVEVVNKFGDPQSAVSSMREIPAKIAKDMAGAPDGAQGIQAARGNQGDEEITIGGKAFKAHWEEWRVSHDPVSGEYTSKTWVTGAVPGGVLRVVTRGLNGTTTADELVEYGDGAIATISLRKAFPSIVGTWQEAPGVVVSIAQTNGTWKASCAYTRAGFGEVRWEMAGTISVEGKISGTLRHTLAPPDWAASQVREGELSKDHNTITGTSNWDGGSGNFTWTRTSGNAAAAGQARQ
jgi:hypothetical protein